MLSYAGVQNQVRLTAQATGRDLAGRPGREQTRKGKAVSAASRPAGSRSDREHDRVFPDKPYRIIPGKGAFDPL